MLHYRGSAMNNSQVSNRHRYVSVAVSLSVIPASLTLFGGTAWAGTPESGSTTSIHLQAATAGPLLSDDCPEGPRWVLWVDFPVGFPVIVTSSPPDRTAELGERRTRFFGGCPANVPVIVTS
jgi:hypothetical protein